MEESAHNTDTVDNQKADGEPWKARKRHIGVLKKIFIEKMDSSKQCDLEESAHNTVDNVDNTKADSEPRKTRKRHIGVLKKIVKYHVRHIDETNLHSKMCLLYK